jgi:MFS family permease
MKRLPFLRLFAICAIGFALTLSSNMQEPALMTHKVLQLAPDRPNTALGFTGFAGLVVAMLVQPIVGVFSDRAHTRLGRRLPFMIGGVVLVGVSLYVIALAPVFAVLVVGVLLIQFSSNIVQGPWQAIIPDLVPETQRGQASGIKAMFDILAFIVGRSIAGQLMGRFPEWGETAVIATVSVPIVIFVIALIITAIWGREKHDQVIETPPDQSIGQALRKAFSVDFHTVPTFGWWFANRFLFWAGFIFLNTFLLTYSIDVLHMVEADAQRFVGNLSIILGGALVAVTLPSGWLADRFGRKPIVIISGFTAFAGTVFLLMVQSTTLITIAAGIIGMSIGAFLSANWALVTDIVPRQEAARYLGIANIATAGGSGLARLLGGTLIDPINAALNSTSIGYIIVYGIAAAFFLISSFVIMPLPAKAKKAS